MKTFKRGCFDTRGRGGRAPLKPKDMYCIIHGKGTGYTSKMYPKVKKGIEEAQEENMAPSQSKAVNHVRQEQQTSHQTYYPMHYGHTQALLLGPPPTYSYEPLAMHHPMQNQWRQEVELESEDKLLASRVRNLENRINSLEAELENLKSKIELNEDNKIEVIIEALPS